MASAWPTREEVAVLRNQDSGVGAVGGKHRTLKGKEVDGGHVTTSGQHLRTHVRLGTTENWGDRMINEERPLWGQPGTDTQNWKEDRSRSHRWLQGLTRPGAGDDLERKG